MKTDILPQVVNAIRKPLVSAKLILHRWINQVFPTKSKPSATVGFRTDDPQSLTDQDVLDQ